MIAVKEQTLHARRAAPDVLFSGMLEASGPAVEEWVLLPEFEARLFAYFPCTSITPALANKVSAAPDGPTVCLLCCPCTSVLLASRMALPSCCTGDVEILYGVLNCICGRDI